ncbi:hypothetical protein [Sorangium sp. So ce233]|uniref:hypothetical protein n=1 Tax=Sorangium sp. So ce233 TaxID=3133290 RepID=UPI003F5E116F
MVDPPYSWYRQQEDASLPGPSAARERALAAARRANEDREAVQQALRELHASAWREDVPEDESELATAEAAAREYWDARWREAPPWDSDPAQTHWLAAVRAARRTSAALASFVPRPW